MISFIKGPIIFLKNNLITVSINGLGLAVFVPNPEIFLVGNTAELFISYTWNQENGPRLFGFNTNLEQELFELIIDCSGCGPKLGLAVLSHMQTSSFISAIICADIKALAKVPGVGTKKAENLILHLKDKVSKIAISGSDEIDSESSKIKIFKDISDALSTLGYSRSEISGALSSVRDHDNSNLVFEELFRKSLSFLAKNRTI